MAVTRERGVGRRRGVILGSFGVAMMLTVLPLPEWAGLWRPAWAALVLIYWCLAVPERVGVGSGFMAGLVLDALTGTLLGQHALGLSVVAFFAHKAHRWVRVLPLWQQGLGVFALVMLYELLVSWVSGMQGLAVDPWLWLAAPLTSTILWPWVFILLRDLRRRNAVH